jgi:Lipocalin-like domain
MFSFSKWLAAFVGLLVVSMLIVSLLAVGKAGSQDQKKTQLEGVWKVAEVVVPASNPAEKGTTITTPQPGLLIFTKGYYSGMAVTLDHPRADVAPPKEAGKLTDAEKIARYEQWNSFIANAGTYEVKGSTLTMHAMVAKSQARMTSAATVTFEIKAEGSNTLWLIPPSDRATTDPRVKFLRLE